MTNTTNPLQPAAYYADMLQCSEKHFADRVAKAPGFPQPIRGGKLVWFVDEVLEYLRTHRGVITRAGRPDRPRSGCNT